MEFISTWKVPHKQNNSKQVEFYAVLIFLLRKSGWSDNSGWSLCTLYLLACQVRVTVGLCCCVCVTSFRHKLYPLCVDSGQALWASFCFRLCTYINFEVTVSTSFSEFILLSMHFWSRVKDSSSASRNTCLLVFFSSVFFLSLLALAWNAHWYCDLWAAWLVKHGSNQMIRLKWKNSSHWGTYLFVWLLGHFSFTFLHPF